MSDVEPIEIDLDPAEDLITPEFLHTELRDATDPLKRALLYYEVGELADSLGDEPSAARDLLQAYHLEPTFREPLESLVRVMHRRRSYKNLKKLSDALVASASSAVDKIRSLSLRAMALESEADLQGAKAALLEASEVSARPEELAVVWLELSRLAVRTNDEPLCLRALEARLLAEPEGEWRSLLAIDLARDLLAVGDTQGGWKRFLLAAEEAGKQKFRVLLAAHDAAVRHGNAGEEIPVSLLGELALLRPDADPFPGWFNERTRTALAILAAARGSEKASAFLEQLDTETYPLSTLLRLQATLRAEVPATHLFDRLHSWCDDERLHGAFFLLHALVALRHDPKADVLQDLLKAIASDPQSTAARALLEKIAWERSDFAALIASLKSVRGTESSEELRRQLLLRTAFLSAVAIKDVDASKGALEEAVALGLSEQDAAQTARFFARSITDRSWYAEGTLRLLHGPSRTMHAWQTWLELVRCRIALVDQDGLRSALSELAQQDAHGQLAHRLRLFLSQRTLPLSENELARSLREVSSDLTDDDFRTSVQLVASLLGDRTPSVGGLAAIWESSPVPRPFLVGILAAREERRAGRAARAANLFRELAAGVDDPELGGRLFLSAGLLDWREGNIEESLVAFENASLLTEESGRIALGWALRVAADQRPEYKLRALAAAQELGEHRSQIALERFVAESQAARPEGALVALAPLLNESDPAWSIAGALALLILPGAKPKSLVRALEILGTRDPSLLHRAAREILRRASESPVEDRLALSKSWFAVTPGSPAALEWMIAASALEDSSEVATAWRALSDALHGPEAEQSRLAAALLSPSSTHPDAGGTSAGSRLMRLESAPPGSPAELRSEALSEAAEVHGANARTDLLALLGWNLLGLAKGEPALELFRQVVAARPTDLAAWEGLRLSAAKSGNRREEARALAELSRLVIDKMRAAAFAEEAGQILSELGAGVEAEQAFSFAFTRDATRQVAFDFIFRRARERKDSDILLSLIGRRLAVTEDAEELERLFWEQARALRIKGDLDGAMKAIDNVRMVEPDHVGALALSGEILIRRGAFEQAVVQLARLATLKGAPAKSRLTAGVTAADLLENKLDRFDQAFDILKMLEDEGLSTLPVRERFARAAARNAHWNEAVAVLGLLMAERPDSSGRADAARLSLAIQRDRLGTLTGARPAILRLVEECPGDADAIDALLTLSEIPEGLLEQCQRSLVEQVRSKLDPFSVRRLSRVASATHDVFTEYVSLSLLGILDPDDDAVRSMDRLHARFRAVPTGRLSDTLRAKLSAPDDSGPIVDLYAAVGSTYSAALGPSRASLGVGKKDLVDPKSGLGVLVEVRDWARTFGFESLDVYVGGSDPQGIRAIGEEPHGIVIGADVRAPFGIRERAQLASELLGLARGTLTLTGSEGFCTSLFVATCRVAEIDSGLPTNASIPTIERAIGKAISRKTKKALPALCRAVLDARVDLERWGRAIRNSQRRAALVATGNMTSALAIGQAVPTAAEALRDARVLDLVDFAFSGTLGEIRRSLGLEVKR